MTCMRWSCHGPAGIHTKEERGSKRMKKEKKLHRTQHAILPARFVCARADKMRGKRLTYNSGKTALSRSSSVILAAAGKFLLYTRVYFVINDLTFRVVVISEYQKDNKREKYTFSIKGNIYFSFIITVIYNCDLHIKECTEKSESA